MPAPNWKSWFTPEELAAHEGWLRTRAEGRLVVRERSFHGANLIGAELSFARFERCDLGRSNLAMARLQNAELVDCDLSYANLTETLLPDASLERCRLDGADASGAIASGLSMSGGSWRHGRAVFAHFGKAELRNTDLRWTDFTAARCPRVSVTDSSLAFARLVSADVGRGASFDRVDLRRADLDRLVVGKTTFIGCAFHGVTGFPVVGDDVMLDKIDDSVDFDGSSFADPDQLLGRWRAAPPRPRNPFAPPYVLVPVKPDEVDLGPVKAAIAAAFPDAAGRLDGRLAVYESLESYFVDHRVLDVVVPGARTFHVAVHEGGAATVLNGSTERLSQVALADSYPALGSEAAILAYGLVADYWTAEHPQGLISRFDDIPWTFPLDAEGRRRVAIVRDTWGSRIAPPKLTARSDGWKVSSFVVSEGTLAQSDMLVSKKGEIRRERNAVAGGLPIVAG